MRRARQLVRRLRTKMVDCSLREKRRSRPRRCDIPRFGPLCACALFFFGFAYGTTPCPSLLISAERRENVLHVKRTTSLPLRHVKSNSELSHRFGIPQRHAEPSTFSSSLIPPFRQHKQGNDIRLRRGDVMMMSMSSHLCLLFFLCIAVFAVVVVTWPSR